MRSEGWTVMGFKRWTQFDELGNDMLKALLRSIVGRLSPTISPVPAKVASYASVPAPTIADHLKRRQRGQLDQSVRDRIAVERFNAWHARAGTGIKAEPIGTPSNPIDAPMAAASFVRWAAERQIAGELKVDDLWVLAFEVFAPAHYLALPPRRVFLGALQRVPGVNVVYDRRVYGRDGSVLGKTTFYTLPLRPAPSVSASPARPENSTEGGTTVVSESMAGNTMPTIEPIARSDTRLSRAANAHSIFLMI